MTYGVELLMREKAPGYCVLMAAGTVHAALERHGWIHQRSSVLHVVQLGVVAVPDWR